MSSWQLAIGYRLLAIGYWLFFQQPSGVQISPPSGENQALSLMLTRMGGRRKG